LCTLDEILLHINHKIATQKTEIRGEYRIIRMRITSAILSSPALFAEAGGQEFRVLAHYHVSHSHGMA
jgi:hypothetical protein